MSRHMRRARRFALVALVGLIAGPMLCQAGAAAQDDVAGSTYTSPAYGFSLMWDPDAWQVLETDSDGRYDTILLGEGAGLGIVRIVGDPDYGDDVDACLDDYVRRASDNDSVISWAPLQDTNGQPIAGRSEDSVYAAFAETVRNTDGAIVDQVRHLECRPMLSDQAVLHVRLITNQESYAPALAARDDLLTGLVLPRGAFGLDPDGAEPGVIDDESMQEGAQAEGRSGVDGNTYTSPTWGYRLSWNDDAWTVGGNELIAASVPPTDWPPLGAISLDHLELESRTSSRVISVHGFAGDAGDPATCVENAATRLIASKSVTNVQPVTDDAGNVIGGRLESGAQIGHFLYVLLDDGIERQMVIHVLCQTLVPNQAVVLVLGRSEVDDVDFERFVEVTNTIELPRVLPIQDVPSEVIETEPDAAGQVVPPGIVIVEDDFNDSAEAELPIIAVLPDTPRHDMLDTCLQSGVAEEGAGDAPGSA